jgi:hypothetical protein
LVGNFYLCQSVCTEISLKRDQNKPNWTVYMRVLETGTLCEGSSNLCVGYISKTIRGTSIKISFIVQKDIGMTTISIYIGFISLNL